MIFCEGEGLKANISILWLTVYIYALIHSVYVYTVDADVLYNKFNVDYNTESPIVPDNPPQYPDDYYHCTVAREDWKVVRCSEKHQVVCQGGQTLGLIIEI